jgi:hypothetical protein
MSRYIGICTLTCHEGEAPRYKETAETWQKMESLTRTHSRIVNLAPMVPNSVVDIYNTHDRVSRSVAV